MLTSWTAWLLTSAWVPVLVVHARLPDVLLAAALYGTAHGAVWATVRARRAARLEAAVPRWMVERRVHGNLDSAGAWPSGELWPLRSVGPGGAVAGARTGVALTTLLDDPRVRLFHGVRVAGRPAPLVAHAVLRRRRIVFVATVVWPPGRYHMAADGRVHCDGVYIGQSIQPLRAAVRVWRDRLPGHRVGVVVVVHRAGPGDYSLPAHVPGEIDWTMAEDAVDGLQAGRAGHGGVSRAALCALATATEGSSQASEGYR